MTKGLFSINLGEFGWELMNSQAAVRYRAKHNGYDHIVVCTTPASFDLYRDFAHEFIPHNYPGIPLCQHRRISKDQPRIDAHWLKVNGCKEYEPYKLRGYDIMYPPEMKPDVRNTLEDQEFIKFGKYKPNLSHDIVIHARNRQHMVSNNWPIQNWTSLVQRLKRDGLKVAVIGLSSDSLPVPGANNCLDIPLQKTMDLLASSRLAIGPSSGPMCLASLCGTPHLVWFGGNKYVGAGLRERFANFWNPLGTQVWPLKLGWKPKVDAVYLYIQSALEKLKMPEERAKENPHQRTRINNKPRQRPVVRSGIKDRNLARINQRMAAVRENKRRRIHEAEERRQAIKANRSVEIKARQKGVEEALPRSDGRSLIIRVPPGIGDFSWIYSKLCTLSTPLIVQVCGGGPPRTTPFADILPKVKHAEYGMLPWPTLKRRAVPSNATKNDLMKSYPNGPLHIEANTHLEGGRRIEEWLPEIGIDHHYAVTITRDQEARAEQHLPNQPFICLFASSDGSVKNWNAWKEDGWLEFMELIRKELPDIWFVLIGARWDTPLGDRIEYHAKQRGFKFTNLTAKLHIASSLHVIKRSSYLVSFPSGMGILAEVMGCPCTMFYPDSLKNMPGSWADPQALESKVFNEMLFCPPVNLRNWLVDEYEIKDKI